MVRKIIAGGLAGGLLAGVATAAVPPKGSNCETIEKRKICTFPDGSYWLCDNGLRRCFQLDALTKGKIVEDYAAPEPPESTQSSSISAELPSKEKEKVQANAEPVPAVTLPAPSVQKSSNEATVQTFLKPAEPDKKPTAKVEEMPVHIGNKPDQTGRKPAQVSRKPEQVGEKPTQIGEKPSAVQEKPAQTQKKSAPFEQQQPPLKVPLVPVDEPQQQAEKGRYLRPPRFARDD